LLSSTSIVSTYGINELHADVDGMLTCDLNALIIAPPDPPSGARRRLMPGRT
jgi:hypothetical protein